MDINKIEEHNKEYQSYDGMTNVHQLMNRDAKDKALVNNWGTIQPTCPGGCSSTQEQ